MSYTDLTKSESSRNCLRRIANHDEPQFSKHSIVNVMEKFVKTVNAMDETILVPCRLMDRQVGDSTDIIPQPGKNSTANQLSSHNHGKRGSNSSKNVHEFLNASELFNLYSMLNSLKNELLWTGKDKAIEEEEEAAEAAARAEKENQNLLYATAEETDIHATANLMRSVTENGAQPTTAVAAATTTATAKGHVRQPSTASIASCVSVSNSSDSESDSGMESDGNKCDITQSGGSSTDSSSSSSSGSENDICSKKTVNLDKATELAKRCKRHLNGLYQCMEQMTEAANYLAARYQSDIGGPV